jgi:outer membrane protein assembly factor BamD
VTSASRFLIVIALALAAACGKQDVVPGAAIDPDRFLFQRGTESLNDRKWLNAREYFRQIVDNYPQSLHRADAKLGLGDSYVGEGSAESLVLALNEFREFLTYYPTHPRADYAQYRLGFTHYRQMRGADRDQTETRDAVAEWTTFLERYPNSSLLSEVRTKLREAKDRLGESDFRVGVFYYRQRWYPGAVDRFRTLLKNDPDFTGRDGVYYYLGASLMNGGAAGRSEALVYFERVLKEFEQSEYHVRAKERIAELQAAPTTTAAKKPS